MTEAGLNCSWILWAYNILPEDCSIKIADADSKFKELLSVTSAIALVSNELSDELVLVELVLVLLLFVLFEFTFILLLVEFVLLLVEFEVLELLVVVLEGFILSSKMFKELEVLDHTYKESSVAKDREL